MWLGFLLNFRMYQIVWTYMLGGLKLQCEMKTYPEEALVTVDTKTQKSVTLNFNQGTKGSHLSDLKRKQYIWCVVIQQWRFAYSFQIQAKWAYCLSEELFVLHSINSELLLNNCQGSVLQEIPVKAMEWCKFNGFITLSQSIFGKKSICPAGWFYHTG